MTATGRHRDKLGAGSENLPPTIPQGENRNHGGQTVKGQTVDTMTDKDAGRVLSILAQTWEQAANMATMDGVPEADRGKIAGPVLTAFLDGVRDNLDNATLSETCARAYLAALTDYRNGGR